MAVDTRKKRLIADAITNALDDLHFDGVIEFSEKQALSDTIGTVLSIEDLRVRNPWRFRGKLLKRYAQMKRRTPQAIRERVLRRIRTSKTEPVQPMEKP